MSDVPLLLTLNAGSSSLKFALYDAPAAAAATGRPRLSGQVERIGGAAPRLLLHGPQGAEAPRDLAADRAATPARALEAVLAVLDGAPSAVAHRVVHGGADHAAPALLTPALTEELDALSPLAPLHQPHNLAVIRAAQAAFPNARQVACFDTAFHRGRPFEAEAFALPRALHARGVRRYGFHGLSYDHVAGVLATSAPDLHAGRVIVAHLGAGASMCALQGGRSADTTMGFSALDGLPMGTRCGQIDPGVLLWLMESEGLDAPAIADLLYKRSGLLGLSGISADMRDLEASDAPEAAQALAHFAFRIRREIGGLAASLGGLDGIVFTAGIGENSARLRAEVCAGLGWLGVALDPAANASPTMRDGVADLTAPGARVRVLVIPTDEEAVLARAAAAALVA